MKMNLSEKCYKIIYITPDTLNQSPNDDPLYLRLLDMAQSQVIKVNRDKTYTVHDLITYCKSELLKVKNKLPVIFIINAFLLPKEEGVVDNHTWNPSRETLEELLKV